VNDEAEDKAEKRKRIESESIFDASQKKKSLSGLVAVSPSPSLLTSGASSSGTSSKKAILTESLSKKISKSLQSEKLKSTGFGISTPKNSESVESKLSKLAGAVVVKKKLNDSNSRCDDLIEPATLNSPLIETSVNSSFGGLVSNYSSDDTESDS
jgi:hypothetical protein